jgi:hypothetical protein
VKVAAAYLKAAVHQRPHLADSVCSPRRPQRPAAGLVVVLDDRLPTTTRMGTVGHKLSATNGGFRVG